MHDFRRVMSTAFDHLDQSLRLGSGETPGRVVFARRETKYFVHDRFEERHVAYCAASRRNVTYVWSIRVS